ncbi:MAG TPA: putative Ig domain-containing protein, partial [Verrucomicrobiae bacterium]|nr:putative Ig domain-containing protein [Verrucomicrobiae bacterium]
FLTDTLSNVTQWQIPDGTTIPAGGYLLVWADEDTGQNDPGRADLHAGFKLSAGGESIWLFAPDGQIVDGVSFGPQITDVSQGRFPDGAASIYSMTNSTPRAANILSSTNTPPTLLLLIDRTVNEGSALTFGAAAYDADVPAQTLTFSLDPGAPAGAGINSSNGLFAWTPAEAQGPGSYPITVRVMDDGAPNLSATRSFTVTVNEVNNAPTLALLLSRTVAEGSTLTVTNSATDTDTPPQSFTYSLDPGAPAGAAIDPTSGLFTWTPSEAQGPGNHAIVIRVTDNGDPPLSGTGTLTVSVIEVNVAPSIFFATNQSVDAGSTLSFTAMATDSDLPAQLISFSLAPGFPAGAGIDPSSGLFTWTPTTSQIGTHNLTVRATDNGTPPVTGMRPLTVVVQSTLRAKIVLNGSQATISFATLDGQHYRVEFKHNLDDAVWTELAQGTGTGSMLTFPDDLGANTHRFYRIVQTD